MTASVRPTAKVLAASTAGTVVEWYDFFIYGTAATLVFGKVFFPDASSQLAGILAALGTYAIGFVARPVGGVVFGHYGDKIGRKNLLQLSLLIIGPSSRRCSRPVSAAPASPSATRSRRSAASH
jgi:MFS family permease